MIHDIPPLRTLRGFARATARTLGVSKRQAHLERKISAQEVRKVGAVRAINESLLILAETEMVEEKIARLIAQNFMKRGPR